MSYVKCYEIALALLCLLLVVQLSSSQSCGKRKVVNFLIVNGNEAKDGYWPWHATIFHHKYKSIDYECGGTIIAQNAVLTAAHCIVTPYGLIARNRLIVHVGRNRLGVATKRVQEHEAFELIPHPDYHVNDIQHDIALIMLKTDITYTDYIQPICLWNRDEDLNAIVGSWGTVIGFGLDENDNVSQTLREASVPIVSHITCIESNSNTFRSKLTSNMFCAGNRDGIAACNGDSGGGLFFNYNDVWFIRGVVSFTTPRQHSLKCDPKEYTVFTDVAKYLDWIGQNISLTSHQLKMSENDNSTKTGLLPMSTCGANPRRIMDESLKPVILGYPWMGLVECTYTDPPEVLTICHATLISDRYLITTNNCGNVISGCSQSSVRLGEYDRSTMPDCADVYGEIICAPPVQILSIESVIPHKKHTSSNRDYDIALIRLRDRADTSQSNVKPICLPVTSELRSQNPTHYIVTLWYQYWLGKDNEQTLQRSLREVIQLSECQRNYKKSMIDITTRHICVFLNRESCNQPFPSAPLQLAQRMQGEYRYVLYGISSFGMNCHALLPEVYTNVAYFVDWILENIEA